MNRRIAIVTLASLTFAASVGRAEEMRRPRPRGPEQCQPLNAFGWGSNRSAMRHASLIRVTRDITGDRCATEPRADADARRHLVSAVKEWLAESGVDPSWTPPQPILKDMVIGRPKYTPETIHDTDQDLNLVRATITADFSEIRKAEILDVYRRQIGGQRLALLGGGLFVILAGLAATSGYIRADEATKGYYTNRLRMLAAVGVGAAGVVAYRILT